MKTIPIGNSEETGGNRSLLFDYELEIFNELRRAGDETPVVWQPSAEGLLETNLGRVMTERGYASYLELHQWSVNDREGFWSDVIERLGINFINKPTNIFGIGHTADDPQWLPGARMNIVDSCFAGDPDSIAIVARSEGEAQSRTMTFSELENLVNRFANGLSEHGFRPNDRIAIYMPMTAECIAAYLGIIRAGCVVISIADSFSSRELRSRLEIAEANGVITTEGYTRAGKTIALYDKVIAATTKPTIVVTSNDPDNDPKRESTLVLRPQDLEWTQFLSASTNAASHASPASGMSNILFSSGTTATPKAIPWTHLTPVKCAMDGFFHQDIREGDVVAWPTNIGWMMGPWLIYASLINSATIALFEGMPTHSDFADFISDAGVTMLGVIPSIVRAWRESGVLNEVLWPSLRVISSTGEPSNREDYLWLMSLMNFKVPIIEYCGGTEIGGGYITGSVAQPASPSTFTTPTLGLDLVILDEEGNPAGVGEMGEVFLIPPSIGLSEKLLNRDHNEVYFNECPRGPRGEILRRHGDQLKHMPGEFFRAQGRADDTMNLGGIKISSIELENVISQHPKIVECAAIAIQPGGEGREQLVVFAVFKDKTNDALLKKELGRLISEKINPLFKINDLVRCRTLPRTASNKVMRRKLRDQYSP